MRKLFALIILAIVAINACSRNAKTFTNAYSTHVETSAAVSTDISTQWCSPVYYEADELKGTPSSYMTMYIGDNGSFNCSSSNKENTLFMMTSNSFFDYNSDHYIKLIVGFYKDGALLTRNTVSAFVSSSNPKGALISSNSIVDKILYHLINVGDIRIIAPLYRGGDFDITIPMNSDIKLLKQVSTAK